VKTNDWNLGAQQYHQKTLTTFELRVAPGIFYYLRILLLKTYNLPDDFITTSEFEKDEVIIRHYQSDHTTIKNKIILNRNMINLLISGSKIVVYPEHTITVGEGELVILSTGNMLTSEVTSGQKDFNSVLIYFSNEVLNRFWIKYESLLQAQVQRCAKQPFLTYGQDAYIQQYVSSLLLLLTSQVALSAEIKQLKLEELLLYLVQLDHAKFQSLQIVSKDQEDLQLKKIVESHIGHPVTVEELAFLCNMSSSTFKKNFSRIYDTSPQQWLLAQKLQQAAELLKSPSESPSAVYLKVGYKNHSSFSQAFRQQFGLNPSDFHAQHLNAFR
jgi:AraC-like DNA-binding protein